MSTNTIARIVSVIISALTAYVLAAPVGVGSAVLIGVLAGTMFYVLTTYDKNAN